MNFRDVVLDKVKLVEEKQAAYGDSFGRSGAVMRALYPDGIPPEKLDDALVILRIVDKFFRLATNGTKDPMGENPWGDVLGYSILAATRVARSQNAGAEGVSVVTFETKGGEHSARVPRCNHWSPGGIMPLGLRCNGLSGHSGQHTATDELNGRSDLFRWNS